MREACKKATVFLFFELELPSLWVPTASNQPKLSNQIQQISSRESTQISINERGIEMDLMEGGKLKRDRFRRHSGGLPSNSHKIVSRSDDDRIGNFNFPPKRNLNDSDSFFSNLELDSLVVIIF